MDTSALLLAVTTLAASFGGYFLAGLNEARRDRRTAHRERESRAEDARLRREEERHRLQFEALIALQGDVQRAARQGGRVLHFDHMQARQERYTQLPEQWSDEQLATRLRLKRNASRILDDEVRAVVQEMSDVLVHIDLNPMTLKGLSGEDLEAAAVARMRPLGTTVERANDIIGSALRHELAWEPSQVSR